MAGVTVVSRPPSTFNPHASKPTIMIVSPSPRLSNRILIEKSIVAISASGI